ncbi:sigma-70 family RNA polymerase sigma factor [Nocardioides pantholopis]|uniref:sigma-70 family RNA polymerase sigma factor n=1 Tax=Nocardioides pantholopis TaxID=2483798 RepID=UPI000F099272|nr:sigma-70 family RNA polymerase sigma factor [Nocardioides pantholopis]
MKDPSDFDAFYQDARERLLLQAFALTGDLPAARGAVRDAFVITWHHWAKVSRSEDPEAWTRPQAWAHAQRRHSARPWHREKDLDEDARATLDALAALTTEQRRILLLTLLANGTLADHAREIGITRDEAERQLQIATAQVSMATGVTTAEVRTLLSPLAEVVSRVRFPQPGILRRAGTRRRRTQAALGALVAVAAVVVSGLVVTDTGGVRPSLEGAGLTGSGDDSSSSAPADTEPPELGDDNLLTPEQVGARFPDSTWTAERTDDNTAGDGLILPCQTTRYADSRSLTARARAFAATSVAKGRRKAPARSTVQLAEASTTDRAAGRAFRTSVDWFAGCTTDRTQLLATYRVQGAGDRASLLVLRDWSRPVTTIVAGVARTGRVTTTVATTAAGSGPAEVKPAARLLGDAVRDLCDLPEAGACAEPRPTVRAATPPRTGTVPAMLSAVDLPPASGVAKPWVGTEPRRARENYAATTCDDASFRGRTWSNTLTRTFVIPGAKLPAEFGITQTVGSTSERRARRFVQDIRARIARCPDRDLGSEVEEIADRSGRRTDLSVWDVTTEVSDDRSIRYLVALVRNGTAVSQVGFVPSGRVQISDPEFVALAERALQRLQYLPPPRG